MTRKQRSVLNHSKTAGVECARYDPSADVAVSSLSDSVFIFRSVALASRWRRVTRVCTFLCASVAGYVVIVCGQCCGRCGRGRWFVADMVYPNDGSSPCVCVACGGRTASQIHWNSTPGRAVSVSVFWFAPPALSVFHSYSSAQPLSLLLIAPSTLTEFHHAMAWSTNCSAADIEARATRSDQWVYDHRPQCVAELGYHSGRAAQPRVDQRAWQCVGCTSAAFGCCCCSEYDD